MDFGKADDVSEVLLERDGHGAVVLQAQGQSFCAGAHRTLLAESDGTRPSPGTIAG